MSVLRIIRDCEGCAKRRAQWAAATRRMAHAVIGKHDQPRPEDAIDADIERRALARFKRDNPGATDADWNRSTNELRHDYRVAVQTE